jgi:PAT family beta-lactamase induction signal transducer AmpG
MNEPLKQKKVHPWAWIPTLYFAEGLPYVAVMVVSVIMYKNLGISNTDIALYTSWLYLPWVIKPFWSPFVDLLKTKRWWIVSMQLLIGAGLAGIAFTLPGDDFFRWSLAVFWLVAFSSATHDISADGFYMIALDVPQQAFYVGIRSTFYRAATITGQGLLVVLAGYLQKHFEVAHAWSITFYILAALFIAFYLYHAWVLPKPKGDRSAVENISAKNIFREFFATFVTFFKKKQALVAILFMLLYRLPEAQLVKLINPFLLDPIEKGGLGLATEAVGLVYGTIGIIGLTLGGIIGGMCAAKGGLQRWLWPMAWSISLTCLTFVYLGYFQPQSLLVINICVFIEQFGYGFGFTAYMLYLIYYSEGEHKTAHYAICTGFMALGMMLPGMAAGWLQEQIGYEAFFVWVMICCVATIGVCALIKIDPNYGKKNVDTDNDDNNNPQPLTAVADET